MELCFHIPAIATGNSLERTYYIYCRAVTLASQMLVQSKSVMHACGVWVPCRVSVAPKVKHRPGGMKNAGLATMETGLVLTFEWVAEEASGKRSDAKSGMQKDAVVPDDEDTSK